jgi:hypothetical protein
MEDLVRGHPHAEMRTPGFLSRIEEDQIERLGQLGDDGCFSVFPQLGRRQRWARQAEETEDPVGEQLAVRPFRPQAQWALPGTAEPTYGTVQMFAGQPPGGEGHELIGTLSLQHDWPVTVLSRPRRPTGPAIVAADDVVEMAAPGCAWAGGRSDAQPRTGRSREVRTTGGRWGEQYDRRLSRTVPVFQRLRTKSVVAAPRARRRHVGAAQREDDLRRRAKAALKGQLGHGLQR